MGKKKTETIGDRVIKAREAKELSRIQLAIDAGVSQGAIQLIERGATQRPSAALCAKLAKALGVTTEFLMGAQ